MAGTIPPIPPPLGTNAGNTGSPNRVDTMPTTNDTINTTTTTNVAQNVVDENLPQLLDSKGVVIKCKTAKAMWNDLILAHEGPSDTKYAKIATMRLKFKAFKALEGEKVNGTFTRLICLLNDLENNGVKIPHAKVNATFVNSLPRKWLSMNQTQRANNSIKNDCLASSSKALISNNQFQDSDSDVEKDLRSSSEFIVDLNAEYPERALLANQKRFYKRSECPLNKTSTPSYPPSNKSSTPSYPSSNKSYNKPKTPTHTSPQNDDNHQKDYKGKYKGLKSEIAVLTKKIDAMSKGKSEKGLVAESFE
ncbi:hypothetical protein Tco_0785344 [Tanacetum coccineum]